ncbi:transcriptional modulator of MazE/toxin, MazF [Rippkaea orientalis PCC 8801]|uniref:Transcriptional modulator of MazE/toxin, MazF n=1 Tax=Rippkaea orientalis (strain PCC 8801 / RF-1) TaxID=41431 RepID=B7K1R7_RIPO1|nr:type II toxin-antitoxin system PemK/MazF family toxin [Rippkaea orientalis]ACK67609.1 transcriptional modulator of MazE/toxin, MazF [Rippkaea orientalis PCC 8801]
MVTYNQFDVVVVPFPLTDKTTSKKRPALVISDMAFNLSLKKIVMAMITTSGHSSWMFDVSIVNLAASGLKSPSLIRMKLFTLDDALIVRKIGTLTQSDQERVKNSLKQLFKLL